MLFVIGFMTMLLSFNASMSYAQGKGGTIKKGALYIGNMENPRQVAVNGTPAWIFSTLSIGFVDDIGKMITMQSVYSINTYTGGLGNALYSDKESSQFSYCVKNGNIYFWDWGEKEPQTESDYPLVLKIEDDYLTLLKTQIDGLKLSKLVYMGDCYKMEKMSEAELDQVEKIAFTSLLYLGVQESSQMQAERKQREEAERKRQEIERQERLERERQAEAKRKREADSIARVEARLNNLKASYSSCRFLFTTDAAFVSCITQESPIAIENGIMSLMDKKMEEISKAIVKGTEFKDQYYARNSMEGICSIPDNMKYVDASIAEYAENKIQDFVNDRKVLSKAYDKAKKKDPNLKCSEFIPSYINDNKKSSNDNRKSSAETTSSKFFAMANLAYSNAPQYSIGLTVGSVKKFGWYVSLNSDISSMANNFKYSNADYECDYLGTINELTAEYSYSGNKRTSRLGATAGMVFKISDPVYAYAGGGYGFRNVFWELENGKWAKCIEDSYKGITLDAGLMMDTRNCAISLGVQTIGVKYIEAKIGVGFTLKGK